MLCCCIRMLDVSSLLLLWVVFDTCARSAPAVHLQCAHSAPVVRPQCKVWPNDVCSSTKLQSTMYPPPLRCISHAHVQATAGIGNAGNWDLI